MESLDFLNQEVEIKRSPGRRNLSLYMHPNKKPHVKANLKTTPQQILEFLFQHKEWIEKNIKKFQKAKEQLEAQFKSPTATEGSFYPFLGELKYLKFTKHNISKKSLFKFEDGFLIFYETEEVSQIEFFNRLKLFYKTEAENYLRLKLMEWVKITGLAPLKLKFRAHRSRWGSCSSNRHISLNWKMICLSPALIDYVIVHELCHLQFLNHSKNFWNHVELFLPAYKETKKVLQTQEHFCRFLE